MCTTPWNISDTAKAETDAFRERGRDHLLSEGLDELLPFLEEIKQQTKSLERTSAIVELENYLSAQSNHLDYKIRLLQGQSIGSGQIEGACKNLVGRRLKQTGARWRPRRVNRMAGLCAVMYSNNWKTYWNTLLG